ncbi:Peptidase S8A, tripeptidyl peptidase II [Sesbania bispinosa]|nr:Peptidase S8A, tripeptidyl peptidase II [Sesbania bispinosa]
MIAPSGEKGCFDFCRDCNLSHKHLLIVFHGVKVNQEEIVLDGSEAPVRIEAEALLASEKLAPVAILNKMRVPYRPIDAKISALSTDRDKLPSGKQILALTLIYKVKLEDGAEIKPQIPFLNGRIYDTKFESQFYMISNSNKQIYSSGDVYPNSTKLPKGEYNLQLYVRHDNLQILEKMKQLVLFIERNLEEKDIIRLSFFSQPDGPLMGNGSFKSSTLIPGIKEGFYLGPPPKDKLPKIDEDKGKNSSLSSKKTVSERLEEEVRDAKIKVLGGLKQESDEERLEWNKLSASLKIEYPKYTTLLAKILEGLVSRSNITDKIHHDEEVIDAANEVIDSIDRDELAKFFALKNDPEDEEAEVLVPVPHAFKNEEKDGINTGPVSRGTLPKGLALAEIESLKVASAATEDTKQDGQKTDEQSKDDSIHPDLFEENFKELKKWV